MSEDCYEHECMRAELLGLQPPDKAEYERQRSARLEQQLAEQDAVEAALVEEQGEQMNATGGKLDELNSILSSTQQKLNRFKQTACGSLSNMFARTSIDVPSSSSQIDDVNASGSAEATATTTATTGTETGTCDGASDGMPQPAVSMEQIRAAKARSQARMATQLDKLDSLIDKADNAHIAMTEQTHQMRKMAK